MAISAACLLASILAPRSLKAIGAEKSDDAAALQRQAAQYRSETAKTIVELQQFRRTETVGAEGSEGRRGKATLINLNPDINTWFLLTLDWGSAGGPLTYHLENAKPHEQTIHLSESDPHGIQLSVDGHATNCDLWSGANAVDAAQRSSLPYAPLCDGNLYLRNRVTGRFTALERVSGFLRENVWGGEAIVGFVRKEFFKDKFIERGAEESAQPGAKGAEHPNWPRPASLDAEKPDHPIAVPNMGIEVGQSGDNLMPGRWYPALGLPGVYVSSIQPRLINSEILSSYPGRVNNLDSVEASAMDYLVAFDLSDFDVGFALGTDHPRVGWSPRPPAEMRDTLPGPDGINTAAPVITNGMVSPALAPHTVATFAGGFKREHGAFRYGPFSKVNRGSHYGFVEQGVVFSKLVPSLATLYVLDDGTMNMKTWTEADNTLLGHIRFARQNGVPLIEHDPTTNTSSPGALVARWGPGNWSGSADEELRSLRAGACLQESGNKRFLIYGYFSTATPSAMARVFQSYGCAYAMHLDMNAPELTYLALYLRQGSTTSVEYLVRSMSESEKKTDNGILFRFLAYPDNRDFFYLVRREQKQ
ncbi:MAG TPA: hypothetical protein VEF03_11930 [Candidatus Binataceae bacterium]|nr:hypothetical protein [Candidatus Binataceae bacterium]